MAYNTQTGGIVSVGDGRGRGVADMLNKEIRRQDLHLGKDGTPLKSEQVYACRMGYKEMFVKDGKLIILMV